MVLVDPCSILSFQRIDTQPLSIDQLCIAHRLLRVGRSVEVGVLLRSAVEDGGEVGVDVRVTRLEDGEVGGGVVDSAAIAAAAAIRLRWRGSGEAGRHRVSVLAQTLSARSSSRHVMLDQCIKQPAVCGEGTS